ncbi:hypothetical protein [Bacillus velezensis]|uniref:hypothetical protein n=1 Tax=Bacillus velezensis TaxID=492670 RepID=UPI001F20400D|nr:hypothetical protein [Bacillus velezensis]UJA34298.1 hypothetical protein L0961_10735 [Bacillus velezensis]
MSEKRKQVKKEVLAALRNIFILIISIFFICTNLSIAKFFDFTDDPRIIWTVDIGIYNGILQIIFSIASYLINEKRLNIGVNIINKKEDSNELTIISDDSADKICLKINIKGKWRKLSGDLNIFFPHWLDIQTKSVPFLKIIDSENKCIIDLNNLMSSTTGYCNLKRSITFDILRNSDENNEDFIQANLNMSIFNKLFAIKFKNEGIKIKSK